MDNPIGSSTATDVLSVVGARPQFVKAAVVSAALAEHGISETLVHTGQHYDAALSDVFFDELGLAPPSHHLGIGDLPHGAMTGRMLEQLERLLVAATPRLVLVYGDTNSTLAGALAAAKLHVDVAHVEAGMRSFNRAMPEELNRILTDHLATLHLVSSETPRQHLAREGVTDGVHVVGDVMRDAFLRYAQLAENSSPRAELGLDGDYALATVHRAENTDDRGRLHEIVGGLAAIAELLPVVFPAHPRTRQALERHQLAVPPRVQMIEPIGYLAMTALERHATLIVTDSGGVQKEAFYAGVPCVTLRDETEWLETVEQGWNVLAGANAEAIADAAQQSLAGTLTPRDENTYGDGRSAHHIARILLAHLKQHEDAA